MKILVVDDEKNIVKGIKFNLEHEGYEVETAEDGEEAVLKARGGAFDLIVMDLMMPKIDGLEACRQIREFSGIPVIMLTARSEDTDKLIGFEYGADDYITKPFAVKELLARVAANIRRTSVAAAETAEADVLEADSLRVHTGRMEVSVDGAVIDLSQREYDLLLYLMRHTGAVASREELMHKVWNYDYMGDLRVVDVAIRRLREKIEPNPAEPMYILTKRGAGYIFSSGVNDA
jgi:DNA-binding response OmpR family regulator